MNSVRTLALFASLSLAASAGTISSVATRAALGGNDVAQWGSLVDDFTSVTSPHTVTSTGGVDVSAELSGGFTIFVEGGMAWTGDFTKDDVLLTTMDANLNYLNGPITIRFSAPVRGLGFNIEHIVSGNFTASADFYGAGDTLFGSTSVSGTTNPPISTVPGSAPFLGAISSALDIVRVDVSITTLDGLQSFAINHVDLLTTPGTSGEVPEPATLGLVSAALLAGFYARRRRA